MNLRNKDSKDINNKGARGIGGFMSGVLVLSLSTVLVKLIGLGVKIPLLSVLGAEGMGYFNSAYEIYALLCVVATAGLPVALSMLVSVSLSSENTKGARAAYSAAMRIFLIFGGIGSGAMLLLARPLSEFIGNKNAYPSILAIAPALLLICVASAVRGYFQGQGNMTPTAVSQLIEAVCKLIFGVGFGYGAVKMGKGLPEAAAMSVLGLTLGILLSCLYLVFSRRIAAKGQVYLGNADKGISARLLRLALPITLGSFIISSCRLIDMMLMLRRLQDGGMDASGANEIYGSYTTLAVPIFGLVPSLVTPVALSLIPALTAAVEQGNTKMRDMLSERAIRMTVLLSMPASMGLALYSRPILSLLFGAQQQAIAIATPLLSVLGMSVMFSGLITATNAILQSYGKATLPMISMGIGAALKLVLAYILIGIPSVGAIGAPISTVACDICAVAVNLLFIGRCKGRGEDTSYIFRVYLRPLGASVLAIALSGGVYAACESLGLGMKGSFLLALPSAVISYIPLAFAFSAISREDIADIPFGNKILGFTDSLGKKDKKERNFKNDC